MSECASEGEGESDRETERESERGERELSQSSLSPVVVVSLADGVSEENGSDLNRSSPIVPPLPSAPPVDWERERERERERFTIRYMNIHSLLLSLLERIIISCEYCTITVCLYLECICHSEWVK